MLDRWTVNTQAQFGTLMGDKGAGLLKMQQMGLPVPPAFVVFAPACLRFQEEGLTFLERDLWSEVKERLAELEASTGKRYGDPERPLLLAVRSGAPVSMPGMMDTVLNVGINDEVRRGLARATANDDFAWDCQCRFLEMVGRTVLGIDRAKLQNIRAKVGLQPWQELVAECQDLVSTAAAATPYPHVVYDVEQQLLACVAGVLSSWQNERAVRYRRMFKIADSLGTGVVVQAMVFGNLSGESGAGVVFSRNPSTGVPGLSGEYLMGHQGEDVVSGEVAGKAKAISLLAQEAPQVYRELVTACHLLEYAARDIQDVEFTFEQGKLYILQVRSAKASPLAALQFLVDAVREGLMSEQEALQRAERIPREALEAHLLQKRVKKEAQGGWILAYGSGVSPGVGRGRLVFSLQEALELSSKGQDVVMVTELSRAEHIAGIKKLRGWFTAVGSSACHAAIVCRELGIPCVVDTGVRINWQDGVVEGEEGATLAKGQVGTVDGSTGLVCGGNPEMEMVELDPALATWVERILGTRFN